MIEELIKNILEEPTSWGAVALYFAQRYIKNEKSDIDDIKDDVKAIEVRQEKTDNKVSNLTEAIAELKGQMKK